MADLWVVLIGGFVGVSELLLRYRDNPLASLMTLSSAFYVLLNAFAAWLALYVMGVFGLAACAADPCAVDETVQRILFAGLGGMAVLRASVLTFKLQDQEIGVGPAAILQIYMSVADRATDRSRAHQARARSITKLMKDVDVDKARVSLPATCFALMQNVSAEEQKIISTQVNGLEGIDLPSPVKSTILGLSLLDIVGEGALQAAIDLLGDEIR